MLNHFYSRYGLALIMEAENIVDIEKIDSKILIRYLENGQDHFRMEPLIYDIKTKKVNKNTPQETTISEVKFQFFKKEFLKANESYIGSQGKFVKEITEVKEAEVSHFLAATIITSNKSAKNAWGAIQDTIDILKEKDCNLMKNETATMSIMPITSKFNNGKDSQSNPKVSLFELACCLITTTTPDKPALLMGNAEPVCIIPDLDFNALKKFIHIFKKIRDSETKNLCMGRVRGLDSENKPIKKSTNKKIEVRKVETVKKIKLTFNRPNLCNGNFPYAPRQSSLGAIGLLGAIGRWAKEANAWDAAKEVLESLEDTPLYIIKYGDAKSVSFGHHIIELAKNNRLCDILTAIEQSDILSEEKRDFSSTKYQLYFLMTARFLQLFEEKSFQDFFSIRAEYPKEIQPLFDSYFMKILTKGDTMEQPIAKEIITSARALGQWLNRTAYFAAKSEAESRNKTDSETIRKLKAKVLAEMESTAMSAKTHDELMARLITRAGRMSYNDAPLEAGLFIDAVNGMEIDIATSRNLVMSYSRLRTSNEELKAVGIQDEEISEANQEDESE